MTIAQVHSLSPKELENISGLHLSALPDSTLSRLGSEFIKAFYQCAAVSPHAILLTAREKDTVVGYALGFINPSDFNRSLLRPRALNHLIRQIGLIRLIPRILPTFFFPPPELKRPQLQFIAVDPSFQGKGLGKKLVKELAAIFSQRGIRQFYVGTSASDQGSNQFYQHLNFTQVGIRSVFGQPQNFYTLSPRSK